MGIRGTRRRVALAAVAVVGVGALMAATGYGTGDGPLGGDDDGGSTVVGIMRPAGSTFSTGVPLRHSGWFDVHLESVRPIPRDGAEAGMPLRELTFSPVGGVGVVDGFGETEVPRGARRPVEGYVVPPVQGSSEQEYAHGLATWQLVEDGRWAYDGYEIVYRHGWVRHRVELRLGTQGCTLAEDACRT